MDQPEQRRPANANEPDRTRRNRDGDGRRPLLWRLPLIAFLVTGIVCLKYLDGGLSSDYRKSAADLAVQADALIESAVANRASSLHELVCSLADASIRQPSSARVSAFGTAFATRIPKCIRVYRLDERGVVRDALPQTIIAGRRSHEREPSACRRDGARRCTARARRARPRSPASSCFATTRSAS